MAAAAKTPTQSKQLSAKEKISHAFEKKSQGNEYFKAGDLRKAIKNYHVALLYVKDIEKPSILDKLASREKKIPESDLTDIKNIRCTCYNNLSGR